MAAQALASLQLEERGGGEVIAVEIGPAGISIAEALWDDARGGGGFDPFSANGARRTLVVDARREPVAVADASDADALEAVFDPTSVPLPLWAGGEALGGFSGFWSGDRGDSGGARGGRADAFSTSFKKTTPAPQRCKNHRKRSSSL